MTTFDRAERLWNLLPVELRREDLERGGALHALLRIISAQVNAVEDDVRDLYDDLFIETCDPWVVPYIGELVGNDALFDASRPDGAPTAGELFTDLAGRDLRPPIGARVRADVARTIHYRWRQGTLAIIEELARHGYKLSSGSLYPMLHAMERKGYLRSAEERSGKWSRRVYRATPLGRRVLADAEGKVRELFGELFEHKASAGLVRRARRHAP